MCSRGMTLEDIKSSRGKKLRLQPRHRGVLSRGWLVEETSRVGWGISFLMPHARAVYLLFMWPMVVAWQSLTSWRRRRNRFRLMSLGSYSKQGVPEARRTNDEGNSKPMNPIVRHP